MHPTESVCIDQLNFGYPAPMIEYPFESKRMVVSLLDSDTITRYPDIKFIVSHGGLSDARFAFKRQPMRTAHARHG